MRRLVLRGEIGCGKSTLIRQALGPDAARAGGFVTLRLREGTQLLGFELAPAAAMVCADARRRGQRFLDFTGIPTRMDDVFARLGAALLREAGDCPFAVADELGGVELLVPEFLQALEEFLDRDLPWIGVIKTPAAAQALTRRLPLGEDYAAQYRSLVQRLEADADTLLLDTTGRGDIRALEAAGRWAAEYTRR